VSTKDHLSGRRRATIKPPLGSRTALYLRVSTADQKPDLQYDGLRAYAARAGLDVILDYCDTAVSGRREGRPRLNALMMAARNHEIDCVLVWKFDRFAQHAPLAGCARGIRPFGRALHKRTGSGRYRKSDGPGDVHHHRRDSRTGIVTDQRARHRRNAGRGSAWKTTSEDRRPHSMSSARSWRSPPQPTSAFGRARPESQGAQAAAWSVRSPGGLA
jgi:hypothetical protein